MKFVDESKIELAINYYGLPFSTENNFRLDDIFIYEDKDYLVVDEDTNIYLVVSRLNNSCIKCKYILTMLNKLTNELVTKNEVIIPIKAFINFFEFYKYLPISYDTFLYTKDNNTLDYKQYNSYYFNINTINHKLLILNLPLIYYAYSAFIYNNNIMLSLLYHLLEYSYYKFNELRLILNYKPIHSSIEELISNKNYLNKHFMLSRERLLIEFTAFKK